MLCELQLINADSVVTFKIHVTQAGAVYDSEPVQIIDLNVMAIQSDVSWNLVGNVRHLVKCAFCTRLRELMTAKLIRFACGSALDL